MLLNKNKIEMCRLTTVIILDRLDLEVTEKVFGFFRFGFILSLVAKAACVRTLQTRQAMNDNIIIQI